MGSLNNMGQTKAQAAKNTKPPAYKGLSRADFLNLIDQVSAQQNPPINTLGANG